MNDHLREETLAAVVDRMGILGWLAREMLT